MKVEANEPLVKAAYVLKSKSKERGLLFDPRRPMVSPTMCDDSSGEEVVAMAGSGLIEVAKNGEEDVYSTPGKSSGGETGRVEVAAGKEWVVPHIETALEDVVRKLRESTKPPKAKDDAALAKLGKGVKMTRKELDEEMTAPCLKGYLVWKHVAYSSTVKKAELVDMVWRLRGYGRCRKGCHGSSKRG